MCIHHVMNIQHAHCSLVGPDHSTWKVGPQVWVHWPTMGIPTRRLQPSPKLHVGCASISWASTLSCLNLCAIMMSSVKLEVHNISWCCQRRTEPWPQVTCTRNLVKIGRVYPEVCLQTDERTYKHTHKQTDRQTHRHGHHNTPLPYWRQSNNVEYVDCIDWAANLGTYVPKSAPSNGVSKQSNNSQCLMSCRL